MALKIEVDSVRKLIDTITDNHLISTWHEYLPSEISLILPACSDMDCELYVLGRECKDFLLGRFPEIENPEEGDIVLYFEKGEGINHVGRYQKDGMVISKWGHIGPVLKYPGRFRSFMLRDNRALSQGITAGNRETAGNFVLLTRFIPQPQGTA